MIVCDDRHTGRSPIRAESGISVTFARCKSRPSGSAPAVAPRPIKSPALLGFSWLRSQAVEAFNFTREFHPYIRPQFFGLSLLKKMAKVSSVLRKWAFAMILPRVLSLGGAKKNGCSR
jgi:hypothetical protein